MAYVLNKIETDFCREYGHSLARAENSFIASLQEIAGLDPKAAGKVFDYYKKRKLVTFDRTNSRYTVKHGGFLDRSTIFRCLDLISAPLR